MFIKFFYEYIIIGICYECGLEVLKANGECYLCREVLKINNKILI